MELLLHILFLLEHVSTIDYLHIKLCDQIIFFKMQLLHLTLKCLFISINDLFEISQTRYFPPITFSLIRNMVLILLEISSNSLQLRD